MNGETLIAVEHVSRRFGNHVAVDDISFSIRRGEVLGFLGPNGAGKTTTMRIICGVLAADAGTVTVAGHDVGDEPRQARRRIGFLPEQPPLYPDLTVDQYLDYCARLRRVPRAKRAAAVANARERCGLGAVGGRLLGNLSRGYQQRAGIAQAIVHSPEVVILDEPTVGLDPQQIVEIRELISELGDRHSVILSTHILPEVQTVCGRVLIIHEGRLVLDSAVETARGAGGRPGFTVGLRNPPTPEEIEALDFAIDVQVLDRLRFRITCRADTDGAEIAAAAAKGGWELFELIPESGTLEEIFLKATRGELAAPAGQT